MSNSLTHTKYRWMPLRSGNLLQITYNEETKVMCVDLVANATGADCGNEIVRMTLNEKKLLEHGS